MAKITFTASFYFGANVVGKMPRFAGRKAKGGRRKMHSAQAITTALYMKLRRVR
jgi:hypothetical protein